MAPSYAGELRRQAVAMRQQAASAHDAKLSADLAYLAERFEAIAVDIEAEDAVRRAAHPAA